MTDQDAYGDVVLQRNYVRNELHVIEAAPRTLVSKAMVDHLRVCNGTCGDPEITLECRMATGDAASLDGDVLTIRAVNRTLVYQLGAYLPDRDAYVAEWPD